MTGLRPSTMTAGIFCIEATLELVLAGWGIAGNELILELASGAGELERGLLTRAPRL
jgi:hypothetical protein